jgi:hypothetical protein
MADSYHHNFRIGNADVKNTFLSHPWFKFQARFNKLKTPLLTGEYSEGYNNRLNGPVSEIMLKQKDAATCHIRIKP